MATRGTVIWYLQIDQEEDVLSDLADKTEEKRRKLVSGDDWDDWDQANRCFWPIYWILYCDMSKSVEPTVFSSSVCVT
jgi:hypothetical protein